MPPKSSSPTMSKTLSAFFTKAETTSPINTPPATLPAESIAVEPAQPTESTAIAKAPTPKKRASRAKKTKETTDNETATSTITTTATTATPKSPTKARKTAGKKETLEAVLIPDFDVPSKKGSKKGRELSAQTTSTTTAAASSDLATTATDPVPKSSPKKKVANAVDSDSSGTLSPPPLGSSDGSPTTPTAKEAPKSPNKATTSSSSNTSANATSSTTTAAVGSSSSSSSNMSKVNKIDTASMFKVRSGKASFTENKLKFSAHPSSIADLCKFHEYRERLQEAMDFSQFTGVKLESDYVEITCIPQEHYGLIAKLVEESDLPLSELASGLKPTLCPIGFDAFAEFSASGEASSMDVDSTMEDVEATQSSTITTPCKRAATTVSLAAITEAIQAVAQRVNYGVPLVNLPGQAFVTPPNLSVFRWEVQDIDQYFPSDMKAAVVRRRTKRMEASAALTAWFLGLDTKQQEDLAPPPVHPVIASEALLGVETGRVALGGAEGMDVDKEMTVGPDGTTRPGVVLLEGQPIVEAAVDPAVLELKLKEAENKKKEAEAKEERRLEKERKMAEKQHEKSMKEAERLQKEEAKKKKAEEDKLKQDQRAKMFVGFFKNTTPAADKKDAAQTINGTDCSAPPLVGRFHPFHVKKNTTLAPINRFVSEPHSDTIDKELGLSKSNDFDREEDMQNEDRDTDMMDVDMEAAPSLDTRTAKTTLSSLFSRTGRTVGSDTSRPRTKKRLPQGARDMSVADVIQSGLLLQEDQDAEDVSSVLTWKDIPALRMRLLQFAENYRPAYYGTWSKRSKNVTGRRILGKDTELVDYDFDSEAEWEEDEEGEECKTDDDDDDAEELGSEQEEEDDWLVPEGYLSDDEGLDAGDEGGGGSTSEMSHKKSKDLRRPTLAHTAPVIVGPVFEITLGEVSTYPALEAYHIEFLGDYGVGMEMYYATETNNSSSLAPILPVDISV
ncbi:Chromatin assembly factor 1, subunit A [Linnemannia exigua]|uniref:Chromatin assembly factor 1, subunit A n=1 Tax=Linnemannia exigua TaxID=604196 RepID=A0AAD4DBM2_9FUNG|nr:Chromatin assembly factor 1, subunit A [Linnemannia exigua]